MTILLTLMLLCSNVDECLSMCNSDVDYYQINCSRALIFALKDLKEEIKK